MSDNKIEIPVTSEVNSLDVRVEGGSTRQGEGDSNFDKVLNTIGTAADVLAPIGVVAGQGSYSGAVMGAALTGMSTLNGGIGTASLGGVGRGAYGLTPTGGDPTGGGAPENIMASFFDQNMYFLMLQQEIQQEARWFQTVSNALKTKFDSEMNSVRNMRT